MPFPTAHILASAALLVGVAMPTVAADARKPCDVEKTKVEAASQEGLLARLVGLRSAECSSVRYVLAAIGGKRVNAGRKLEPEKALSVSEAQAERAAAMADPTFKAALDAELQGENDALRRLVLEAAALHDHGHYKARDLLVQQLRSEVGR